MITVIVYALTMPPAPMFAQVFADPVDADRYESFWRRLGFCHLKRQVRPC